MFSKLENDNNQSNMELSKKKNTSKYHHGVFRLLVPLAEKDFYENEWLHSAYEVQTTFKGFCSRHVHFIKYSEGFAEYVVVLVFDSQVNYRNYLVSPERVEIMGNLTLHNIINNQINAYGGLQSVDLETDNFNPLIRGEDTRSNSIESESGTGTGTKSVAHSRITLQNTLPQIPKKLPPPKWKMALIIINTVYICILVSNFSGFGAAMVKAGLPKGLALFISILHLILMLQYAGLPIIMSTKLVDHWLKQPRIPPEDMSPILCVLDQGLMMFAARNASIAIPTELLRRIDKLEARLEKVRDMNHFLENKWNDIAMHGSKSTSDLLHMTHHGDMYHKHEDGNVSQHTNHDHVIQHSDISRTPNKDALGSKVLQQQQATKSAHPTPHLNMLSSPETAVTLMKNDLTSYSVITANTANTVPSTPQSEKEAITCMIRHYVKWECVSEFESWTQAMEDEMAK